MSLAENSLVTALTLETMDNHSGLTVELDGPNISIDEHEVMGKQPYEENGYGIEHISLHDSSLESVSSDSTTLTSQSDHERDSYENSSEAPNCLQSTSEESGLSVSGEVYANNNKSVDNDSSEPCSVTALINNNFKGSEESSSNGDNEWASACEELSQDEVKDDDEDKDNPQYIPKCGYYYEHDNRTSDNQTDNLRKVKKEVPMKDNTLFMDIEGRWCHDKYNEKEQAPKTTKEIIETYGYDIRSEDTPPPYHSSGFRPMRYSKNEPKSSTSTFGPRRQTRSKFTNEQRPEDGALRSTDDKENIEPKRTAIRNPLETGRAKKKQVSFGTVEQWDEPEANYNASDGNDLNNNSFARGVKEGSTRAGDGNVQLCSNMPIAETIVKEEIRGDMKEVKCEQDFNMSEVVTTSSPSTSLPSTSLTSAERSFFNQTRIVPVEFTNSGLVPGYDALSSETLVQSSFRSSIGRGSMITSSIPYLDMTSCVGKIMPASARGVSQNASSDARPFGRGRGCSDSYITPFLIRGRGRGRGIKEKQDSNIAIGKLSDTQANHLTGFGNYNPGSSTSHDKARSDSPIMAIGNDNQGNKFTEKKQAIVPPTLQDGSVTPPKRYSALRHRTVMDLSAKQRKVLSQDNNVAQSVTPEQAFSETVGAAGICAYETSNITGLTNKSSHVSLGLENYADVDSQTMPILQSLPVVSRSEVTPVVLQNNSMIQPLPVFQNTNMIQGPCNVIQQQVPSLLPSHSSIQHLIPVVQSSVNLMQQASTLYQNIPTMVPQTIAGSTLPSSLYPTHLLNFIPGQMRYDYQHVPYPVYQSYLPSHEYTSMAQLPLESQQAQGGLYSNEAQPTHLLLGITTPVVSNESAFNAGSHM